MKLRPQGRIYRRKPSDLDDRVLRILRSHPTGSAAAEIIAEARSKCPWMVDYPDSTVVAKLIAVVTGRTRIFK